MELKIYQQEDRLAVAAILIKNGYTVGQTKRQRGSASKSVDYYLVVSEDEANVATER